jgi:general secretion pathway protein A
VLEEIRMLSNLETEKEKLIQIILVGQPELKERLNSPELSQLRQRIAVRFHITPLEEDEIGQYIYHRLRVAGAEGTVTFSDEAIEAIFKYSSGIPRLINMVCDRALLLAWALETRDITDSIVSRSIQEVEGMTVHDDFPCAPTSLDEVLGK